MAAERGGGGGGGGWRVSCSPPPPSPPPPPNGIGGARRAPHITKGPENKLIFLLTYFNAALALGYRIKAYSYLVHVQTNVRDCRRLNCYLFYHVLDKMKRRQVHLDEAWSLKRDKIQVIEGGNEQTKDTGPIDL